jgi:hypothetical protein
MSYGELQWLAGIFEGEGTVCFVPTLTNSAHGRWDAQMSMTDEDIVRRFHSLIGIGSVIVKPPQRNGWQRQWRWKISAQEDVLNFCALLQPYMGERRAAKMAECVNDLVC